MPTTFQLIKSTNITIQNYTVCIKNQQIGSLMQIQNVFTHNYQYIYKLWPANYGQKHMIELQIHQIINNQMNQIGKAATNIIYSYQNQMFKFYINQTRTQLFLIKFYLQRSTPSARQESELIKINKDMQQDLIKYKKQIQNYQEFLYFTNNVIKQLNNEEKPQNSTPQQQKNIPLKIQSEKQQQNSLHQNLIPQNIEQNHEESNISQSNQQSIEPEQKKSKKEQAGKISKNDSKKIKSLKQSHISSSRISKAHSFLSKYRYLQNQNDEKDSKFDLNISKKTNDDNHQTIKRQIQIIKQQPLEFRIDKRKNQQQANIENQIKQRRQQYLHKNQNKKRYQDKNDQRSYLQTPIRRLSTLVNKNQPSYISKVSIAQLNNKQQKQLEQVKSGFENNIKKSTRCQTSTKQLSKQSYIIPQNITTIKKQSFIQPIVNIIRQTSQQDSKKNIIHQNNMQNNQVKQQLQNNKNQNGYRRKKVLKGNSQKSSVNIEKDSAQIKSKALSPRKKNSLVIPNTSYTNKIIIFNLKSLFYTNFKNSIKKCIVQHSGQVYETQLSANNLKETFWQDRIIINSLSPTQQIIFQIYSINNIEAQLEGSSITNINDILTATETHFKRYLYYQDIAVGFIEFDINRQEAKTTRLSVSLPAVKAKKIQDPLIQAPSFRVKTQASNIFKIESHPSELNATHSIHDRQLFGQQDQSVSHSQMNKRLRNLKLRGNNKVK